MTAKKRFSEKLLFYAYIAFSVLLLAGAVTFSVLYDKGYRVKGFSIQRTSTLEVQISEEDTWVFIGETPVHLTKNSGESISIPNVEPGNHLITVIKDKYFPWAKKLDVPSDEILILYPFLLKQNVEAKEIMPGNSDYIRLVQHFRNKTKTDQVYYETDTLIIEATESGVSISKRNGPNEKPIKTDAPVTSVHQFLNNQNVVTYTTQTEMWVSELIADTRIAYKIFEGKKIRLLPENDTLFVQDGNRYFKINL